MNHETPFSRLVFSFAGRSSRERRLRLKRSLQLNGMERLENRALMAGMVQGSKPVIPPTEDYVADQVIVKLKPETAEQARLAIQADLGAQTAKTTRTLGIEVWRVPTRSGPLDQGDNRSLVPSIIDQYWNDPRVDYIEPDYIVHALLTPNDTQYNELWGMNNTGQTGGTADADIDAPEAWNRSTGSRSIIVGVIDTGVDYNHPDLVNNIWTNPGEIPGDNIDNDNNGFIDDVHGYDFVNNDGDPIDDHNHGTHCSGTIAGEGDNGQGVVGVNWQASIMGIKFLNSGGSGSISDAVLAQEYANMNGANLTSNSWGGGGYSQAMHDAIDQAATKDMLFVAAAGNGNYDNDVTPFYPATYDNDNLISVAASDHNDVRASFSQWGKTTVDLTAPGVNILSSVRNGGYAYFNGTSMATPHVAGVAALLLSVDPTLSYSTVKSTILDTVDVLPNWNGLTVTGGRLNASKAIETLFRSSIRGFGPDVSYVEQAAAITIDNDASFGIPGVSDLTDYKFRLSVASNASPQDAILVKPNARVALSGNVVLVDGNAVATNYGGIGVTPLVVTFNANATEALASVVLQSVAFRNMSDTPPTAPRSLQLDLFDNLNVKLVSATKLLTIQAVDDASVLSNFGTDITYTENSAPTLISSTVTLTDIDSTDLGGGRLVMWIPGFVRPDDKLSVIPNATISVALGGIVMYQNTQIGILSGGVGANPLIIGWNQSATLSRVQEVMQTIGYSNTGNNPTSQTRIIRAKIMTAANASSNFVSKNVDVTPVNDAPSVSGFSGSVVFQENSNPILLAPTATLIDPDSNQFGSLTLSISQNADPGDRLSINNSYPVILQGFDVYCGGVLIGNYSGGDAGSDLVINFNASANKGKTQAVIRALQYSNSSDTPSSLPRTIELEITDSDAAPSPIRKMTATITPTNDPPEIGLIGGPVEFVENSPPIPLSTIATVFDPDSADFNQGTLKVAIAAGLQTYDELSIIDSAAILTDDLGHVSVDGFMIGTFQGGKDFNPLQVSFNALATPARVQTLVRQIAFAHLGDNPSSTPRKIQFAVSDGDGGFSSVVTKVVNVTPVNDATIITDFGAEQTYTENSAPIFVSALARVIDPDSPNFDQGAMQVTISENADPGDKLAIRSTPSLKLVPTSQYSKLLFQNVEVGVVSGIGTQTLAISWNQNSTPAIAQLVLRRVTFETTGDYPSTLPRTILVGNSDGDGGAGVQVSKVINVKGVNDPTIISVSEPGPIQYVQSSKPGIALLSGATVTDPDTPNFENGFLSVKIISGTHTSNRLAVSGRISLNGNAVMLDGTTQLGTINLQGGLGTRRLLVSLNANATLENLNVLLRSGIFYTEGPSTTDTRVIEVLLIDGVGRKSNLIVREVDIIT